MSEHYQQLPTPAAWMTLESNGRPNPNNQHSNDAPPSPQTPETARRILFQPMKNSRSSFSVEGSSPPKHPENKSGSIVQVTSQYDNREGPAPPQQPTPPTKQDHYQDFSVIARDHPSQSSGHSTPATQSPVVLPRDYQALPTISPRNRTATSYTMHTSPSTLVSPPSKTSHTSENNSAVHYQPINSFGYSSPTATPSAPNNNKSHYMAVPDFAKLLPQKSESFAAPALPKRTHAATVADGQRRIEAVASDSVLYTSRPKGVDSVDSTNVPPQRDEYQKIPSKEEMQSMLLQKRAAQNQATKPHPNSPDNSNANVNIVPENAPQTQEGKVEEPAEKAVPVYLEGYLGKKGDVGVIKAWKRRWFVLRLDLLIYYKSREDREGNTVIGFVPLCDASSVYPSSNAPNNTAFQIDTKERVWYLRADTKPEMDLWIEACKTNCSLKELPAPLDDIQKRQSMVAIARNQTLTREGDLEKLHGNNFRMRKVLVRSGILYKYLSKTDPQPSKVTLFKCTIDDEVPEHGPLAFRVSCGPKAITFRASSDREKEEWLELLMKHKLLTETIINPH